MKEEHPDLLRVVVLASGRGTNFEALIKDSKIEPLQYEIVGLVSDKKNSKALEIAKQHKIQATFVPASKDHKEFNLALLSATLQAKPDLVVLAGFMRILTNDFIAPFEGRLINIHPSLLPAFKGLHAQQQALEAGVKEAGCTVHFVTTEVDSGEIIAQSAVPVLANDTVESLSARILIEEHKILPKALRDLAKKILGPS